MRKVFLTILVFFVSSTIFAMNDISRGEDQENIKLLAYLKGGGVIFATIEKKSGEKKAEQLVYVPGIPVPVGKEKISGTWCDILEKEWQKRKCWETQYAFWGWD
jgi:hypothetical protein